MNKDIKAPPAIDRPPPQIEFSKTPIFPKDFNWFKMPQILKDDGFTEAQLDQMDFTVDTTPLNVIEDYQELSAEDLSQIEYKKEQR